MLLSLNASYSPHPSPRKVRVDAALSSLFHRKGRDDPDQLTWNELMSQFMENLRPAYTVTLPGGEVVVRWVGRGGGSEVGGDGRW